MEADGGDELVECPVCGLWQEAGLAAQLHVDAHFAGSQQHAAAAPAAGGGGGGGVVCSVCGEAVRLADIESHEEAHRLQGLEDASRRAADAAEAHQFEALQSLYGFADKPAQRPGRCYTCGQPGHWQSDCPSNPNRIGAAPRLPPEPSAVAAQQRREPAASAAEDVAPMLRDCLIAGTRAHSRAYICGHVAHLSRAQLDSGWGCGYRNLQMLASHLLARRPDVAPVLFGGCGWLPDLPSLQAWLEAAWEQGFDPPGRRQMGGHVQGTRKWIGTPEVAALLRQFGIDARVVDFCAQAPATVGPGGATVHRGVACDLCECSPIVGVRHKSTVRSDFDVCARCRASPAAAGGEPYIPLGSAGGGSGGGGGGGGADAGAVRQALREGGEGSGGDDWLSEGEGEDGGGGGGGGGGGSGGGGGGGGKGQGAAAPSRKDSAPASPRQHHPALMEWVWNYFSSGDGEAAAGGGSGGGGGGASSGAGAAAAPRDAFAVLRAGAAAAAAAAAAGRAGGGAGGAAAARGALSVVVTSKGPLYLQHDGHSRTVVGIERLAPPGREAEYKLLVLDPSTDAGSLRESLRHRRSWEVRVKRGAGTLSRPEFQILYVPEGAPPAPRGSAAWEALKTIRAEAKYYS
ncbi:hypothetical protein Rsub_07644 [Raphidocelis subcapitata]|uniref:CCHC-type domain-containing protein n=1 Tax=Raphidocelis subcapitata TaxID=307507 RepID=A0A2V0P4F4_9CHLO|nr:hypothetical protein Rsub_07644 [Raphidocelis subcapitata]|eukprot:GBF94761.1 hypothetical protein Rsub_07644 [Raphidocelis subcapitata]